MENFTSTFSLDYSFLNITPSLLTRAMGYQNSEVPEPFPEIIDHILKQASQHTDIQTGFKILPPNLVTVEEDRFHIRNVTFHAGKIISKPLKKSTTLAIFVTTVGRLFDEWRQTFFERNDLISGYVVDTLGSEIAECAADWIEPKIIHVATNNQWGCSNRYSPGYCGWSVEEQHKLFSFLPPNFCGVSLTDTALMIPIKSVSGVIGLGPNMKRSKYPCKICDKEDCFRRRENLEDIA